MTDPITTRDAEGFPVPSALDVAFAMSSLSDAQNHLRGLPLEHPVFRQIRELEIALSALQAERDADQREVVKRKMETKR